MRRRWLVLGLVFTGTFAAAYLLTMTGQLPATSSAPTGVAAIESALKAAAIVTLLAGYGALGWRVIRGGSHTAGTSYAPDFAYHGTAGGRYPLGSVSASQIEQASGPTGSKP